ncbi:hypothetical protein LTR15_010498 [Elasticomyces elasticus]|nr:hypothetical protein LTR15_010498 [Elasticomyces elasticus]
MADLSTAMPTVLTYGINKLPTSASEQWQAEPMPSPATPTTPAAAQPVANVSQTTTGLDSVEAAALRSIGTLAGSINEKLSSDIYGNFFIEGAKIGKDTRHGELGVLFTVVARAEELTVAIDKRTAALAPKAIPGGGDSTTANKNMTGMQALVEQEVDKQMRDAMVLIERLWEEVARRPAGEGQVKTKSKKSESGGSTEGVTQFNAKFDEVRRVQKSHDETIDALQKWQNGRGEVELGIRTRMYNLETWRRNVEKWQGSINSWRDSINAWQSRLTSWGRSIDSWRDSINSWKAITVNKVNAFERWKKDTDEKVGVILSWKGMTESWATGVGRGLDDVQAWKTWMTNNYNSTLANIDLLFARRWY